ncbi:MAG: Ig-like domain-containing protein [Gemmatimonadales bacterium]|nr:Ig-like domain-containing protein [Gemmatimonadales bacterium]
MLTLLLVTALQQPAAPTAPRVVIDPAAPSFRAGDTLRLRAEVLGPDGKPMSGVRLRWFASGRSTHEGGVDSAGLVSGGYPGKLIVTVLAQYDGGSRPVTGTAVVTVLPFPPARVEVTDAPGSLLVGQSLTLGARVLNHLADQLSDPVRWTSDNSRVVEVSASGRVTGRAPGTATITARAGSVQSTVAVTVVASTLRSLTLGPVPAKARTGDVLRLAAVAQTATGPLANPRPEWSATPAGATIDQGGAFVADDPGRYTVTANLAGQTATTVIDVAPRGVARVARTVGRLPIDMMATEFWLLPDGRHGLLATAGLTGVGGDKVYAVDVSDPAAPRITDSVTVDARIVNDVMATEDGKFAVMTREQASTRKNGIVILSLADPAHPKPIADYTATVSGGVHSAYVYQGHVYLTDDATGSMRVIDIADPYHPREVGRWQLEREAAGRYIHDLEVRDGLAYLAYWNDGLVILDVGNGVRGGSPTAPKFYTQFKYDLDKLYQRVEAAAGPGYLRGTHTAWRHKNYVFVGDEVFPAKPIGKGVANLGRAFGRMQVVDISDPANPKSAAWFESEDGGAHNFWVAGDTLFVGDYQGGMRVLDISGELKGDLGRNGRLMTTITTADAKGHIPNSPSAWGGIYRNGYLYVPDTNSGLWIVQLEPKRSLIP